MAVAGITTTSSYLSFTLDGENFAIEVNKSREVLDFINVTKVPHALEYMIGVINVRGSVVPVIDMRMKFGIDQKEQTVNSCIILVELSLQDDDQVVGCLVDSVHEVLEIKPESIEPAPKIGTRWNTEYIRGIGNHNGRFIIILNIDRIFSDADIDMVQKSAAPAEIAAQQETNQGREISLT